MSSPNAFIPSQNGAVGASTATTAAVSGISSIAGGTTFATGPMVSFADGGGVSFGVSGNTITASVLTASDAGVGLSAGTQSVGTGVVAFVNSNGISFGMSGSTQVTASVSTLVFSNSNNITFGLNGSTITASASVAATAETPFGVSAGTQSVSTGTLVFSNSNGISFGMSGSSRITASYSQSTNLAAVAAAGSTGTSGTVVWSNSNNVSFGMNGNTITASASSPAETPFGVSAGTQSVSTGTLSFANSNGVTFGMSGSSQITASYSQSTAPNAIAVNAAGAVTAGTVVFSNSNNVSFGLNGSTITASAAAAAGATGSAWSNFDVLGGNQVQLYSKGQILIQRVWIDRQLLATRLDVLFNQTFSTQNNSGSFSHSFALYTLSGSTASQVSLASSTYSIVVSATATSLSSNITSPFAHTGWRYRTLSLATWNITPGDYLLAHAIDGDTANFFGSWGVMAVGSVSTFNTASTEAIPAFVQYVAGSTFAYFDNGSYSTTSASMPASIHVTQILRNTSTAVVGQNSLRTGSPVCRLFGTF